MGDRTKLALALMLVLVAITVADGMEYTRIVPVSEILTNISKDQPVEYDHVIIKGNLSLSSLEGLPSKHVDRTDIEKKYLGASEDVKIIASPIRINDSVVDGVVNLSNTIMENTIDFKGSTFISTAGFRYSQFNSTADFGYSQFKGDANFRYSQFKGDANFGYSQFNSTADFGYSQFKGDANFRFSQFNSTAGFIYSRFNSTADFWFSQFDSTAGFWFSQFDSTADFSYAQFKGDANFRYSQFNNTTSFGYAQFEKEAHFEDAQFNGTAVFYNSRFKDDALFEGADFREDLSLGRARYGRLYIRWYNITRLTYDEAAYLSLMKNFKELGYLEDYDCCYFQYRTEHRDHPWPAIGDSEEWVRKWIVDRPLEWFYGYGTRPLNPLGWSIVTILLFGIIWRWAGLGAREWPPATRLKNGSLWWHALTFSLTVFLSGTKFFVDPPDIPSLQGRSENLLKRTFIVERALGAFFSILFFLAIGATVVRQ